MLIRRDDNFLLFLNHYVSRIARRGGGSGCKEQWQSRMRRREPMIREKIEEEV